MEGLDIGLIIGIASLVVGLIGLFIVNKKNSIKIKMENKNGDNIISNSKIVNEKKEN